MIRLLVIFTAIYSHLACLKNLGTEELRNPRTQELINWRSQELKNSGAQELRISRTEELGNWRTQELKNSGAQELKNSGTEELRNSRPQELRMTLTGLCKKVIHRHTSCSDVIIVSLVSYVFRSYHTGRGVAEWLGCWTWNLEFWPLAGFVPGGPWLNSLAVLVYS